MDFFAELADQDLSDADFAILNDFLDGCDGGFQVRRALSCETARCAEPMSFPFFSHSQRPVWATQGAAPSSDTSEGAVGNPVSYPPRASNQGGGNPGAPSAGQCLHISVHGADCSVCSLPPEAADAALFELVGEKGTLCEIGPTRPSRRRKSGSDALALHLRLQEAERCPIRPGRGTACVVRVALFPATEDSLTLGHARRPQGRRQEASLAAQKDVCVEGRRLPPARGPERDGERERRSSPTSHARFRAWGQPRSPP